MSWLAQRPTVWPRAACQHTRYTSSRTSLCRTSLYRTSLYGTAVPVVPQVHLCVPAPRPGGCGGPQGQHQGAGQAHAARWAVAHQPSGCCCCCCWSCCSTRVCCCCGDRHPPANASLSSLCYALRQLSHFLSAFNQFAHSQAYTRCRPPSVLSRCPWTWGSPQCCVSQLACWQWRQGEAGGGAGRAICARVAVGKPMVAGMTCCELGACLSCRVRSSFCRLRSSFFASLPSRPSPVFSLCSAAGGSS